MTWEVTCLLIKIDLVMTFFCFLICINFEVFQFRTMTLFLFLFPRDYCRDIHCFNTRFVHDLLHVTTDFSSKTSKSMKPKFWELMLIRHFINVYKSSITKLVFLLLLCLCWNLNTGNWALCAWHSVVPCIYVHSGCEAASVLGQV